MRPPCIRPSPPDHGSAGTTRAMSQFTPATAEKESEDFFTIRGWRNALKMRYKGREYSPESLSKIERHSL